MHMRRQIKVTTSGTLSEKAKENFNEKLAQIIVHQYGVEFAKELLEELKKGDD